jgi:glycosyltransferase involved in cell wall biosynthesis
MRVLYLTADLNPANGWGRYAQEIIGRLAKKGVETDVLTTKDLHLSAGKGFLKRFYWEILDILKVRSLIKNKKIDIVHSLEGSPHGLTAYFAGFGLKIKKVITAQGAYSIGPLYNFPNNIVLKKVYRDADKILCVSRYIKKEIDDLVDSCKTEVVTSGVDFEKFSGERKMIREPFIISAGNLVPRKGYKISIAAFIEIAKNFPNLKYYIAGEVFNKGFFDECQKLIDENNLQDRVIFLGSVDTARLRELYLSAELFILTSINEGYHVEGFGLVFLEAAAAGLPVIGTTNNGITDAVNENVNGLLVPQHDVQATARALLKIFENPELKKSFSDASIKWAKENSWDKTANGYLEAYKDILK